MSQGLLEQHKPAAAAHLCFLVLSSRNELPPAKLEFLLQGAQGHEKTKPCTDWLPGTSWSALLALGQLEGFAPLLQDLEASSKRWKEWYVAASPEEEPLPGN